MTMERLTAIIVAVDPEARLVGGGYFELTIDDGPVLVVTDPLADRMRSWCRSDLQRSWSPKNCCA